MEKIYPDKYYEQVRARYPDLSISQIEKIIKHGLRSFYMINLYGGDVLVKTNYYTAYFGKLFRKKDIFYKYRKLKWRIKYRMQYKRRKTIYNGKYYFGIKADLYNELFPPKTTNKGRSRSRAKFDKITIYKIYDEVLLDFPDYVFEIDHEVDGKFAIRYENKKLHNFRLIAKRNKDGEIEPVSQKSKNETKRK